MLIKTHHAKILLTLLDEGFIQQTAENQHALYVLELQNLVVPIKPDVYTLSYVGKQFATIINSLIEEGYIDDISLWKPTSQFIDSRVVSAILSASLNKNRVCHDGYLLLNKRGLVERKNRVYYLNRYGKRLKNLIQQVKPRIRITTQIARYLRNLGEGPLKTDRIDLDNELIDELEAMRIITFALPKGGVLSFTGVGRLVKKLVDMIVPTDTIEAVLDDDIFYIIRRYEKGVSLTSQESKLFYELGYFDSNGAPTKAFSLASEIFHLLLHEDYRSIRLIDLELAEIYLLDLIARVHQKEKTVSKEMLYRELFQKPLDEVKHLKEFYGRRLRTELGAEKRLEIEEKLHRMQTIEEVFQYFYHKNRWKHKLNELLSDLLFSLESFGLIVSDTRGGYQLTDYGRLVLEEQRKMGFRSIRADAVKAINLGFSEKMAINIDWYQRAYESKLVSEYSVTKSGLFYSELAYKVARVPYLTTFETTVFRKVPLEGVCINELYEFFGEDKKESVYVALQKLQARNLIRILPDGGVTLTRVGRLLLPAIATSRVKRPLNPLVIKVVSAIAKVKSLYAQEDPKRFKEILKEASKKSGLDVTTFRRGLKVAREAGFIGTNGLTKAGKNLIAVLESVM